MKTLSPILIATIGMLAAPTMVSRAAAPPAKAAGHWRVDTCDTLAMT
jgi:hypothetical protein